MLGPFQLNVDGNVIKTELKPNDAILYIVVGRYCKHDYIDNGHYKEELKKYLQHEPATKAYFICPEADTSQHSEFSYFKLTINISPAIKRYSVFRHAFEQIVQQLPTASSIRMYGHSYGGYFASRMMRELIKYYDRRIDTDALKPKEARAFIQQTLRKLTVVTFGGARFHNYMHQIKHLQWYRPNIRHYIYTLDLIQMFHREIYKRDDVVILVPSLLEVRTPTEIFKLRFIFHNYDPFIQFIYRTGRKDLLNPMKPLSKMLRIKTGDNIDYSGYDPMGIMQTLPYDVVSVTPMGNILKRPTLPIDPKRAASISQQSPLPTDT